MTEWQAGWYQDPEGPQGQTRWWDGQQWTEHRSEPPAQKPQWVTAKQKARPQQPQQKPQWAPTAPKEAGGPGPWAKFRKFPVGAQVAFWIVGGILLLAVIGGATSGMSSDSSNDSDEAAEKASAPAPVKKVVVKVLSEEDTDIAAKAITVKARVKPANAEVLVNGDEAKVDSAGNLSHRVKLDPGDNTVVFAASRRGYEANSESIYVTRNLTDAEKAARAEKRRQKREAAIANLRASATQLDTGQFDKDPDRYAGQKVVMSGEVLQIQEGGDNFLIMTTGCETEYDVRICNGPEVYVGYGFDTDKSEDDLVTAYGTVVGRKDYETTIGGTNSVGEIKARLIE